MMNRQLKRDTGLAGALVIGLGSILGTGAYVSVGMGAAVAGDLLIVAILIASFTALCNGLSSAQLAAAHPVSGGTYEYGYRYLNPSSGLLAGILFLVAKSASAATAALAVAWYISTTLGFPDGLVNIIAVALLLFFTCVVLAGVKRTNWLNLVLVTISLAGLAVFVVASFTQPAVSVTGPENEQLSLFYAAALLFVAFTGYGRIATMGEEIANPRRTIPIAVVLTLGTVTIIYLAVGMAVLHVGTPSALTASNFNIAQLLQDTYWQNLVIIGGIVAMSGVVLNLVLGVSRVFLAMGRRQDLPVALAKLNSQGDSAPIATWATFALMAAIALFGELEQAWAISAFSVLIYYGLTNLAALKVERTDRFIPKVVSFTGLVSCLTLVVFIPSAVMIVGSLIIISILAVSTIYKNRPNRSA